MEPDEAALIARDGFALPADPLVAEASAEPALTDKARTQAAQRSAFLPPPETASGDQGAPIRTSPLPAAGAAPAEANRAPAGSVASATTAASPDKPGDEADEAEPAASAAAPPRFADPSAKTVEGSASPAAPAPASSDMSAPSPTMALPVAGSHPHAQATAAQPATGAHAGASHPIFQGVSLPAVPVEIGLRSLEGINRFDIRLAPGDLGQIDVRLDITEDGRVKAHLVVERPEAYLHLQRETGHLERALEQAGLKTGDDGVALSLRQQGSGDGGRNDGRDGRQQAASAQGREMPETRPEVAARQAHQQARHYAWSHASGVDRRI